jgi:hypothetical protein
MLSCRGGFETRPNFFRGDVLLRRGLVYNDSKILREKLP